jgi:hypothetical protein
MRIVQPAAGPIDHPESGALLTSSLTSITTVVYTSSPQKNQSKRHFDPFDDAPIVRQYRPPRLARRVKLITGNTG